MVFAANISELFFSETAHVSLGAAIAGIVGGSLFVFAYAAVAFIALTPARLTKRNAPEFARAAFNMLTTARDEDYVQLFRDVVQNVPMLFKRANFNDVYLRYSYGDPPTAFFDFIHRKTVEQSEYARSLLLTLADEKCCSVIVRNDPMTVVSLFRIVSDEKTTCRSAQPLMQELAAQSVLLDDSMLAREAGYDGFGHARVFMDAVFGDEKILTGYDPFNKLEWIDEPVTEAMTKRLSMVAKLSWSVGLKMSYPQCLSDIARVLESASQRIVWADQKPDQKLGRHWYFYDAVGDILKDTRSYIASLASSRRRYMYNERHSAAYHGARLANEILEQFSGSFQGVGDFRWHSALEIFNAVFPRYGETVRGCDPLQHQLALEMAGNARKNIDGYHPSTIRVFLAVFGPYQSAEFDGEPAHQILTDAMYSEIRRFDELHSHDPRMLERLLPDNVKYDAVHHTLTHTFAGGDTRETNLKLISPDVINFNDHSIRLPDDRVITIHELSDPIC